MFECNIAYFTRFHLLWDFIEWPTICFGDLLVAAFIVCRTRMVQDIESVEHVYWHIAEDLPGHWPCLANLLAVKWGSK